MANEIRPVMRAVGQSERRRMRTRAAIGRKLRMLDIGGLTGYSWGLDMVSQRWRGHRL
jgi:hypothetical protein